MRALIIWMALLSTSALADTGETDEDGCHETDTEGLHCHEPGYYDTRPEFEASVRAFIAFGVIGGVIVGMLAHSLYKKHSAQRTWALAPESPCLAQGTCVEI